MVERPASELDVGLVGGSEELEPVRRIVIISGEGNRGLLGTLVSAEDVVPTFDEKDGVGVGAATGTMAVS